MNIYLYKYLRMKTLKNMLMAVLMLVVVGVHGQSLSLIKAERLYAAKAYSEAIPKFEAALHSDSTLVAAMHKLAECYRMVENYANAAEVYATLEKRGKLADKEPIYYAQALMQLGNFDKAKDVAKSYQQSGGNSVIVANILDAIENLHPYYLDDTTAFSIQNLKAINTSASEIGPTYWTNGIVYSSNQYLNDHFDNRHEWTGQDFYTIRQLSDGKIKVISKTNSKYNSGPSYFDRNDGILYVTQNVESIRRIRKQANRESVLSIVMYRYDSTKRSWCQLDTPFPFNNDLYNIAHVAINGRGDLMAFASDMPGGFGGMDIYLSKKVNGVWGKPVNIGGNINTTGNEVFPSFYGDGVLFFSSDGQPLHGGLDILYAKLSDKGAGTPRIIPLPVNSNNDDFGIQFSDDKRSAMFVSNRSGGAGSDDIYVLDIKKPFSTDYLINGVAVDKDSKKVLPNTSISLADSLGVTVGSATTDSLGQFQFRVEEPIAFDVKGTRPTYIDGVAAGKFEKGKNSVEVTVPLTPTFAVSLYGLIVDKRTAKPLDLVKVKITDVRSGDNVLALDTDASGSFLKYLEGMKLNDKLAYNISLECSGYIPKKITFNKTITNPGQIDLMSELDIAMEPFEVGKDIGKLIQINPIYFDLSKWNIRPDAAIELDKIVKVMQENPTMEIELGSHTDCRSSAKFNQVLSEKRAKSSTEYIVGKGISASRITFKGYGESRLINKCACEGPKKSKCPESEHAKNRRTEFIITRL